MRHLSPLNQLSRQPPLADSQVASGTRPCWWIQCRVHSSFELRSKGRPEAPLFVHPLNPEDCLAPSTACLSRSEKPISASLSAVRGWPGASTQNHPTLPSLTCKPKILEAQPLRKPEPTRTQAQERHSEHLTRMPPGAESPCQQHTPRWHMNSGAVFSRLKDIQFLGRNLSDCPGSCAPPWTSSSARSRTPHSSVCPKTGQGLWVEQKEAAQGTRETGGPAPTHGAPCWL